MIWSGREACGPLPCPALPCPGPSAVSLIPVNTPVFSHGLAWEPQEQGSNPIPNLAADPSVGMPEPCSPGPWKRYDTALPQSRGEALARASTAQSGGLLTTSLSAPKSKPSEALCKHLTRSKAFQQHGKEVPQFPRGTVADSLQYCGN